MEFTAEQRALIAQENPEIAFELNGIEVLAFYSLGQMHKKVVRMTDNFFGQTHTGVFTIEELNGQTELDFSNPDDWTSVNIESITLSLYYPNEWGSAGSQFHNLLNIKSIALLKQ